ncbi:hypothetical protein [Pediococcus pentosaceus]|uniref:hypothetical protein n=1 Tax=Pediococcus pentosaceus TaxID=1255 RepID=UPI001E32F3A5|nr:hypothetical protein [Pediococcus pentosaceus]
MYVIENTANGRYYRKLGVETHQYTDIGQATTFSKWKKAKQKADILHAAISPIGEQINFEVKQHKFYVLKNQIWQKLVSNLILKWRNSND